MVISDHIMRLEARERVTALEGAAAPRRKPPTTAGGRAARSRQRRAQRVRILGLRGMAK